MRSFFILIAIFFSYTVAFSINNHFNAYQNWLKNESADDIYKVNAYFKYIEDAEKLADKEYAVCIEKRYLLDCKSELNNQKIEIFYRNSGVPDQELLWIYESLSSEKKEVLRMARLNGKNRLNTYKNIEIPKYRNPINWQILAISIYLGILLISWISILSFIRAFCQVTGSSNENGWRRMFYVVFGLCIITAVVGSLLDRIFHHKSFLAVLDTIPYLTGEINNTVGNIFRAAESLGLVFTGFGGLSIVCLSILLGLGYISRGFTTKNGSFWNRISHVTIKNSIVLDSFNSRELLLLSIGFLPGIIYIGLNQLPVASETGLLAITLILSKVAIFPAALKRGRELSISTGWVVFNYIFLPIFFTGYLLIQNKKTEEAPQKNLISVN